MSPGTRWSEGQRASGFVCVLSSLFSVAAEPSRSCCLLSAWRSGPLCYNERHMGLGPRITQRPYKLSSLGLPGGVASEQLASQSPFSRPLTCSQGRGGSKTIGSTWLQRTCPERRPHIPMFKNTPMEGSRPEPQTSWGRAFTFPSPRRPGFTFLLGSLLFGSPTLGGVN